MRILFYLEPHPIRRSFTGFAEIARNLVLPLVLSGGGDNRLTFYANRETLDTVLREYPVLAGHAVFPTEDEEALFRREYCDDWAGEGITRWKELLSGGALAEAYSAVLEAIHARHPFDLVVYWGTNAAVTQWSARRGIPALAMELGCSRPPHFDSLVIDPEGVNGNAIFTRLSVTELEPLLGHEKDEPFLEPDVELPAALARQLEGQKKTAFLPLQLYDDANLLQFSHYATPLDFVRDVVPPLIEAGYFLVVKDHPGAFQRESGMDGAKHIADYLSAFPGRYIWLPAGKNVDNRAVFSHADLVVTINSSLGFEASLYGKVVVVQGRACYKLAGLFPTLEEAFAGGFDRDAYHKRLRLLHRLFHRAVLHAPDAMKDAAYFHTLAAMTVDASREAAGDAALFARRMLERCASLPRPAVFTDMPAASAVLRAKRFIARRPVLLRLALPLHRRFKGVKRLFGHVDGGMRRHRGYVDKS